MHFTAIIHGTGSGKHEFYSRVFEKVSLTSFLVGTQSLAAAWGNIFVLVVGFFGKFYSAVP